MVPKEHDFIDVFLYSEVPLALTRLTFPILTIYWLKLWLGQSLVGLGIGGTKQIFCMHHGVESINQ